jgi:hypothetical protein
MAPPLPANAEGGSKPAHGPVTQLLVEDSGFRAVIDGVVTALRHVLPHVPCQDFVDERLVSDTAPARFLAELLEHPRIEANRDELTWLISEGRPIHAPHNLRLLRRRIGNVRKTIFRRVRCALAATRAPRADEPDRFRIASSPNGVRAMSTSPSAD